MIKDDTKKDIRMKKQLLLGLIFVVFCFSSCTNECMNESVNEESEVFMLDSFKKNWRILKDAAKVKRENNNLLYSLENGMEDEELTALYKDDIIDVESMTKGNIVINYCDVDLNCDGFLDKLVFIRSPLHSGAHGDTFEILLNEGGTYTKISEIFTFQLFMQDGTKQPGGVVKKHNRRREGFRDIEIITAEEKIRLGYEEGKYQIQKTTPLFLSDELQEEKAIEFKTERTTETDEDVADGKCKSNGKLEVTIERVDKSIKNELGQVIAVVYYDKPVVSGDSEAAKTINAFFEEEVECCFSTKSRMTEENDFKDYCDCVNEMKNSPLNAKNQLVKDPLHYVIETRIVYMSEDKLSIFQMKDVMLGRGRWSYYGITFDLNIGEIIPITDLIEIPALGMKRILEEGSIYGWYGITFDELGGGNYIVTTYFGDQIDMRYEYFYDGENFYIIDNRSYNDGYLYMWNGKWGQEYEMTGVDCYFGDWPKENLSWSVED